MDKPFVLIIEDERDIAALFRHVMDLAGYRTEIASNGDQALERLSSCLPDIILLDLSLPGVSGVDILRIVRQDERLKRIPIVVVTAYSELAENLAVEPDLVMFKPVSAAQLTGLVQRLAGASQMKQTAPFRSTPWDQVTGLYNRPFFLHRLDSAIRSLKDNGQNLFAVLALGSDRYDAVARKYGALRANDFLHDLAISLKTCMRPTDTVARFEPDRFFILLEQAPGLHVPEMIAERIQHTLSTQPSDPDGGSFTCDIGVLLCDNRYSGVDEIMRDAASAYAFAQAIGPGGCLTFDHDSIHTRPTPAT